MTNNYYGGQHVNMHGGSNNLGINNGTYNNAQADVQDSLRELIDAVNMLRGQVPPADREVIDSSMRTIGAGTERQPMRRALSELAGIATVIGQVGAPVVDAVRKVMTAFAL